MTDSIDPQETRWQRFKKNFWKNFLAEERGDRQGSHVKLLKRALTVGNETPEQFDARNRNPDGTWKNQFTKNNTHAVGLASAVLQFGMLGGVTQEMLNKRNAERAKQTPPKPPLKAQANVTSQEIEMFIRLLALIMLLLAMLFGTGSAAYKACKDLRNQCKGLKSWMGKRKQITASELKEYMTTNEDQNGQTMIKVQEKLHDALNDLGSKPDQDGPDSITAAEEMTPEEQERLNAELDELENSAYEHDNLSQDEIQTSSNQGFLGSLTPEEQAEEAQELVHIQRELAQQQQQPEVALGSGCLDVVCKIGRDPAADQAEQQPAQILRTGRGANGREPGGEQRPSPSITTQGKPGRKANSQ